MGLSLRAMGALDARLYGKSDESEGRTGLDADAVLLRQIDVEHGGSGFGSAPLDDGRARIVRGDRALAHIGLDVLVAEGHVVPARVANLVGEDRRRPLGAPPLLVEETVRQGEAPSAAIPARNVGERAVRGRVLLHRTPPDDRVELGQIDELAIGLANYVDVLRSAADVVPIVDGARAQ